MNRRPSQLVSGLVDGIDVLHELAESPEPVSGVKLARKLGLDPVRVNRLLMTLAWLGIAHRDESRRYTSGPGMHTLAAQSLAASGLLSRAMQCLRPLLAHPHAVAIGVLWRDKVTFLYHRNAHDMAAQGVRQWITPATESSVGMALLAHQPDEAIRALYGDRDKIPGLYDSAEELIAALDEIRAAGQAVLRHDTHTSMAVAVGRPPYAAVAVSGFHSPADENLFGELLHDVARRLATDVPLTELSDADAGGDAAAFPSELILSRSLP